MSERLLPERGRWAFIGQGSLPDDPLAREHEQRGRRWLILSYAFCPCHVPLTLAVLGGLLGGTTVGTAIAGNGFRVGVALTAVYALVLWRGFGQIRRAKRIEAAGGRLACTPEDCGVAVAGVDDAWTHENCRAIAPTEARSYAPAERPLGGIGRPGTRRPGRVGASVDAP